MRYQAILGGLAFAALAALCLAGGPAAQTTIPPTGSGATFWVYVSPQNQTAKFIRHWRVEISRSGWRRVISSENPQVQVHAPRLAGEFAVKVLASGPKFQHQQLPVQPGGRASLMCSSNCDCVVGIIANQDGVGGVYWTVSDAICR
jgi:hypothetical protein